MTNMIDLYALTRPALFKIDPETAHNMMLSAMKRGLVPAPCGSATNDPALETEVLGLKFPNPVGLAAGFDKNAQVIGPALKLGFGFAEAGTVTPKPQDGNPKPRVFRDVSNNAIINRLGFPNLGMTAFKDNLETFLSHKPRPNGVVGINIGMNKASIEAGDDPSKDYATLIRMLAPMADYLTVNISSPNTPGLRNLQEPETLKAMIKALRAERKKACGDHPPPIFVKFAPDLSEKQQEELAATAITSKIDGLILGNTTLDRPAFLKDGFRDKMGGLSGEPLTDKSTEIIRNFYALTQGKIPIIGVGGISTGRDAYAKIKAGASLIQLYTSLVYRGPSVASCVNTELLECLKADGHSNIADAVGSDHR
jgi:dihydroorotate dehydrogenase